MPFLILTYVGSGPLPASLGAGVNDPAYLVGVETFEDGETLERFVLVTKGTKATRIGGSVADKMLVSKRGRKLRLKLLCVSEGAEEHEFPIEVFAKRVDTQNLTPDYFGLGWDQLFDVFEEFLTSEDGDIVLIAKEKYQEVCVPRAGAKASGNL